MTVKFYRCRSCGQIVAVVKDTKLPIVCCGAAMEEIKAGTVDAMPEKHVPIYEKKGNLVLVTVGIKEHPMTPDHYIEWIVLQTRSGNQRKCLAPGDKPQACFAVCEGDEIEAVYAYCNLHSLWKTNTKNCEKCSTK